MRKRARCCMIFLKGIISLRSKDTVRKRFKHVNCTDDEVSQYFRSASAARNSMNELNKRSWEYQHEFATEMSKQCTAVMGKNHEMKQALEVFEHWYVNSDSDVLTKG